MNVITQLEFELAYTETAIKHFNHYVTGTPHLLFIDSENGLMNSYQIQHI